MNTFDTKVPQKAFNSVFRLMSRDGVIYFGEGQEVVLDYSLIDVVDASFRLLVHMLSNDGCRVRSYYSGFFYDKESLKVLWNKIKREEKLIRKDGIVLTRSDKTSFTYIDDSYRVIWPSFEAFYADYTAEASIAWITVEIPTIRDKHIKILKEQKNLFDKIVKIETTTIEGYERFTFSFDIREEYSHASQWRRITESLVSVLNQKPEILETAR